MNTVDLWRGMKDVRPTPEFASNGGTELAPMSTTTSAAVALQYASGGSSMLLFKLRTENFMQRGASIGYLSAFPPAEFEKVERNCDPPPPGGCNAWVPHCAPASRLQPATPSRGANPCRLGSPAARTPYPGTGH